MKDSELGELAAGDSELPTATSAQAEVGKTDQPKRNRNDRNNEIDPDLERKHNDDQRAPEIQLTDAASDRFREAKVQLTGERI